MASSPGNSSLPALDLNAVIQVLLARQIAARQLMSQQGLPACKRCRECRRGCDTLLPKCRSMLLAPDGYMHRLTTTGSAQKQASIAFIKTMAEVHLSHEGTTAAPKTPIRPYSCAAISLNLSITCAGFRHLRAHHPPTHQ